MKLEALVEKSLKLEKWPIGRLISIFEDTRPEAALQRQQVLALLAIHSTRKARFIGLTGPPGVGKSTLVGALAPRLLLADLRLAVAVLAIDPSSPRSGGALLGDRTRVKFPAGEKRLFFRSQASALALGGVGRYTYQVCRLLAHLFDIVLLETVGIGQSETDIGHLADATYLILQPMTGDQIQFLKAGIMEIPDAFVFNKSDLAGGTKRSQAALQASFGLLEPGSGALPTIHEVSALQETGLEHLAAEILARPSTATPRQRDETQLVRWVRGEFGRRGARYLADVSSAATLLDEAGDFDAAQLAFARLFGTWLQ